MAFKLIYLRNYKAEKLDYIDDYNNFRGSHFWVSLAKYTYLVSYFLNPSHEYLLTSFRTDNFSLLES